MKKIVAAATLVSANLAIADDFPARVEVGKLALRSRVAQEYESSWAPQVSGAMTACTTLGIKPSGGFERFAFVGNISAEGKVSDIEVRPKTALSLCFAKHFNNAQLPPPPKALLNGDRLLPVSDELESRS